MTVQVAILAGGLATRLGDLTKDRPKSLIEVVGKPFMAYQLELLRQAEVTDIVLCVGYLWQQIERYFGDGKQYGVTIRYSVEERPLGTAGALKMAEPLLGNQFFTLYGDSYLFLDFALALSCFEANKKLAMMAVYKNNNLYDRSNTAVEGSLVTKYSKSEKTENMVYIDYGINLFNKDVLRMVPANQFYSLDDLFPRLIAIGELLAFEVSERFYEIGSPQGLKELEEFVRRR